MSGICPHVGRCLFVGLFVFASIRAMGSELPRDTEGIARIAGLRVAGDARVELIATSPQIESPIAICVDEKNRVFVAEVHRFNRGTEENRNRTFLLDHDLAAQTIDDRLRAYERHLEAFGGSLDYFRKYSDRIVRLEDRDSDGLIDHTSIFADDFRDPLSGLGAGLIARDHVVWYTNIPELWRLEDHDDDGVAESRRSLHRGFGVQNAFLGHDLHGLAWGPDGKLYFSVGDRGFHVETSQGEIYHGPRHGAVFRCHPDGSDFEVVFQGLRNPQELAFDDEGNLYAADNNCDKGDHARLVMILTGGHAGWNMAYQTLTEPYLTGPWHAEGIWQVPESAPEIGRPWKDELARRSNTQPAWIVPPIGAIGAGPAGFTCHPGTGPFAAWAGHLLMCNFTGQGGLEAFRIEPHRSVKRLVGVDDLCKPISATDVEFTYDGRLLLSDYVGLNWDGSSAGGRIYAITSKTKSRSIEPLELSSLDDPRVTLTQWRAMLDHDDRRIRQRAQFALAQRKREGAQQFADVLESPQSSQRARRHALWGLGQMGALDANVWRPVRMALLSSDPDTRAQAARVVGWGRVTADAPQLIQLLKDDDAVVVRHAAESLGQLGDRVAIEPLFAVLSRYNNRDPWLRHVVCYALYQLQAVDVAAARYQVASPSERLGAVLVLRHARDPRLVSFLQDREIAIVTEAARAIHDLPLDSTIWDVAIWKPAEGVTEIPEALWRRVIHANFLLGDLPQYERVVEIACDKRVSLTVRREALDTLRAWARPSSRDRVTGFWRPVGPRDPQFWQQAVRRHGIALVDRVSLELRGAALEYLDLAGIALSHEWLAQWLASDQPREVRRAAVRLTARLPDEPRRTFLAKLLQDADPGVRIAACQTLAPVDPAAVVAHARDTFMALDRADVAECQVLLALLAPIQSPEVDAWFRETWARIDHPEWPPALTLDLLEAAQRRAELVDRVTAWQANRESQSLSQRLDFLQLGGDATRGRSLFFNHVQAQCVRCHQIDLDGGVAGPKLNGVATRAGVDARRYFVESLLEPSARLATGFEQVQLELDDGRVVVGIVVREEAGQLVVREANGTLRVIDQPSIVARHTVVSAMPAMGEILSKRELRDVVEFLMTLR